MIELIPNPRELSLAMREADISLRMRQPEQHDLVVRRIGGIAFAIYATPEYVRDQGDLDFEDGCPGHRLITQLADTQQMTQSAWLTEMASRSTRGRRCSASGRAVDRLRRRTLPIPLSRYDGRGEIGGRVGWPIGSEWIDMGLSFRRGTASRSGPWVTAS